MVVIGSIDCVIDYFVGLARKVGNSKVIEAIVDYFSKHYSNYVDYILEDLGYYDFSIDYHIDLNFAKGPEAYLDVGPMVGVEQQRILAHHLHLS